VRSFFPAISLAIALTALSSPAAAQLGGAGGSPAGARLAARPLTSPRPTFRDRLRGAFRGAVLGFRLGAFRQSAAAAANARMRPGLTELEAPHPATEPLGVSAASPMGGPSSITARGPMATARLSGVDARTAAARRPLGARTLGSMIRLPDVRQATDYTCGASALQSVLAYFGRGGDQGEGALATELRTDAQNGTEPQEILRVAREHGLTATMHEGMSLADLESHVSRGVPVIVDYQAWSEAEHPSYANDWDDGHYSVVVGIDQHHVYLEDPSILGSRGRIPRAEFEARWHDIGNDGRRYHRMGIALESPTPPQFQVHVGHSVPTE